MRRDGLWRGGETELRELGGREVGRNVGWQTLRGGLGDCGLRLLGCLACLLLGVGASALLLDVEVALSSGVVDELLAELVVDGLLGEVHHLGALLDVDFARQGVLDLGDGGNDGLCGLGSLERVVGGGDDEGLVLVGEEVDLVLVDVGLELVGRVFA